MSFDSAVKVSRIIITVASGFTGIFLLGAAPKTILGIFLLAYAFIRIIGDLYL